MWELSCEPMFQLQWRGDKGIEFNYVGDLRGIINAGVHYSTQRPGQYDDAERMRSFYKFVAHQMFPESEKRAREQVQRWLESSSGTRISYDDYWYRAPETNKDESARS
jgi:hypothetical protein